VLIAEKAEELKQTAFNAEKDLNSYQAKQGLGKKSDSSTFCYVIMGVECVGILTEIVESMKLC
jgi:hypothetical protein